jgi:hypothetical protein
MDPRVVSVMPNDGKNAEAPDSIETSEVLRAAELGVS